jgi:hypothetical protein
MNNLTHGAKAALNVLEHVQLSLQRIADGNGSAELLPTIADQLRDALKIVEMTEQGSAMINNPALARLADKLADDYGPVPLSRSDLLAFLADQVERIREVGVPDSATATRMIDAAYVELIEQQLG